MTIRDKVWRNYAAYQMNEIQRENILLDDGEMNR